jgi:hypothetical protein
MTSFHRSKVTEKRDGGDKLAKAGAGAFTLTNGEY